MNPVARTLPFRFVEKAFQRGHRDGAVFRERQDAPVRRSGAFRPVRNHLQFLVHDFPFAF